MAKKRRPGQRVWLSDPEKRKTGARAILVAVLTQAVADLYPGRIASPGKADKSRPLQRINAARWMLGIGEEDGGVSLRMIAEELDLDREKILESLDVRRELTREIKQVLKGDRNGQQRGIYQYREILSEYHVEQDQKQQDLGWRLQWCDWWADHWKAVTGALGSEMARMEAGS